MADLGKRAREWLLSSQYNLPETADLVRDMADEIERLETYHKAEYEIVDRIWKVLGIETFEDAKGREISEIVQDKLDEIERLREALRLAKEDMLRAVDHIDDELEVKDD